MKALLLICGGILFLSLANLPIGFYTFLRIVVTIGAIAVVVAEIGKGLQFWSITFIIIAIIFNPLIPVYLHSKSSWTPIDIIGGILFIIRALTTDAQPKQS